MLNCIDRWIDRLDGVYEPPCSTAETVDNIAGTLLHLGGDTPRHIAVVSTLRSGEPARCCSLLVERLRPWATQPASTAARTRPARLSFIPVMKSFHRKEAAPFSRYAGRRFLWRL